MLAGPDFVRLFGEEVLSSIGARDLGGSWLITGCDDPEEWTVQKRTPLEAKLVELLGSDYFFNPDTGALPTAVPIEFSSPPYPIYIVDDTGEGFLRRDPDGTKTAVAGVPWKVPSG